MEKLILIPWRAILASSMTPAEIAIRSVGGEIDLSPEEILECCLESPGVWSARHLGDWTFELDTDAGPIKFKITRENDTIH